MSSCPTCAAIATRTKSIANWAAPPTPPPSAPASEQRSVLRPVPRGGWWPYIWSVRTALKVGSDGRVPIGSERLRVGVSVGTRVVHCLQPNGTITILAHPPKAGERPALLLQIRAQ